MFLVNSNTEKEEKEEKRKEYVPMNASKEKFPKTESMDSTNENPVEKGKYKYEYRLTKSLNQAVLSLLRLKTISFNVLDSQSRCLMFEIPLKRVQFIGRFVQFTFQTEARCR